MGDGEGGMGMVREGWGMVRGMGDGERGMGMVRGMGDGE